MNRKEGQQKLISPSEKTPNTENFHKVVKGKDEGQKANADKAVAKDKEKTSR